MVFVRDAEGFEAREVAPAARTTIDVEIVSGLDRARPIAVANTFILKAELAKSEAEHEH